MNLEFSRQIFEKYSNTKFHENPSSWSRVALYGRTDVQIRTERHAKLLVAFRNFLKASKKGIEFRNYKLRLMCNTSDACFETGQGLPLSRLKYFVVFLSVTH